MTHRFFVLASLALTALIVFLFVSAPPPLPEQTAPDATITVESVLALAESENDAIRALWTREIVDAGQQAGLRFSEDWREPNAFAGPLPALFLRETARNLERDPVRLSLFLGSDAPINPENGFKGLQQEAFQRMRATGAPQFFRMPDTGLHTAMFPDEAVAEACVNCHNDHEDSPRTDWQLDDVMGATTWAYPDALLTGDDMIRLLVALRSAFRRTYQAYLDKTATFPDAPEIGLQWPRDGNYLPTADAFMEELYRRTAKSSLDALLQAGTTTPPTDDADP